jgi:molybdopterin-containing oxidoreductase family membrane subunit
MGTLYGVYLVVIVAELYFLLVGDHARARVGAIITVVAALTIHPTSNLGSVFGLSHSRPYWYGPLLPVYMIATALVSGTALLALAVYLGDYFGSEGRLDSGSSRLMEALRRLLALFLGITVFLTVWRTISGLGGQHYHSYEITMALLTGPLFLHFWLFEVFLGIAVPLWILLGGRGSAPPWVALAAGLTMLGMFVARNDLVYAGQMLSLRPVVGHMGETLRYSPPFKGNVSGFLAYTPSLIEVTVVAGAISAVILLYAAGLRVLRLSDTRQAESRTRAVMEV